MLNTIDRECTRCGSPYVGDYDGGQMCVDCGQVVPTHTEEHSPFYVRLRDALECRDSIGMNRLTSRWVTGIIQGDLPMTDRERKAIYPLIKRTYPWLAGHYEMSYMWRMVGMALSSVHTHPDIDHVHKGAQLWERYHRIQAWCTQRYGQSPSS